MLDKNLLLGEQARAALARGMDYVADSVKVTLGPQGRNVVLGPTEGLPRITNSGASIAAIINAPDRFEDQGCLIIQEAAENTKELTGDGSTTAIVLAQAITHLGLRSISAGMNAAFIVKGIEIGKQRALIAVEEQAVKLGELSQVRELASVAAGDALIAEIIVKAVERLGLFGVIMVEEGHSVRTHLEFIEGLRFDKGCFLPQMAKAREGRPEAMEDAYVLIVDGKIASMDEIVRVLEFIIKEGKPLLVIAEDIASDVMAALLANMQKGTMNVVPVRAPGYGQRRQDYLEDIAVICGGTVISEESGASLNQVGEEHLGRAERVFAGSDSTTIIGGFGDKEEISARAARVKEQYEARLSGWSRDKLEERLGWLMGGVAMIYVGAATRLEMLEKKERIHDAVSAVKAALKGGIVPGGGVALMDAVGRVDTGSTVAAGAGEQADAGAGEQAEIDMGMRIIKKALEAPIRQIVHNAGQSPDYVLERIRGFEHGYGYDAKEGGFVEMLAKGICDPTLVVCTALKSAVSVAELIIETEGIIVNPIPEIMQTMGVV